MKRQRNRFELARYGIFQPLIAGILAAVVIGLIGGLPATARADAKMVADARKKLTDAQLAQKTANDSFTKAKEAIKAEVLGTPEAHAANDELAKAKANLDTVSKPVIEKSHEALSYKSSKQIFDQADAKLKAMQVDPTSTVAAGGSGDELTKLTTARADARQAMEKAEADALAGDAGVQSAKTAVDSAKSAVDELTKKVDAAVADDGDCQAAKQTLEDAEKVTADARTALAAAVKQSATEARGARGNSGGGRPSGGRPGGGRPGR